jgi:aldehyde:ferredoxin oxidoreductase
MSPLGYHGTIAHVDLGSGSTRFETPNELFWRRYAGSGLLGTPLLLRDTPPGVDPLSGDNLLVLASSVVTGYPFVGLARFTVTAKSPQSGGIGEARCEGRFGIALKGSGVDALALHGSTPSPRVVVIEEGRIRLDDAADLWGLPVNETVDRLEHRYGARIATAVVGPAGERAVRFASIVAERTHQAARTGLGAVMGAKRVKAIVIASEEPPLVADLATCQRLTEEDRRRVPLNPLTRWQWEPPGFSAWVHTHGTDTALCTRNYRDSVFEAASAYDPTAFMARYVAEQRCPGCPNNCMKLFFNPDHPGGDFRAGAMHQEITGSMGPNLGITDVDTIFTANILCNDLGLDPNALGFTLSMAMECVERGILDEATIGLRLRFGADAAVLELIPRIVERDGFGDVLAEGAMRAAAAIGSGAERYAMHVKGVELVPFEPRTQTNLALGYATAPVGPRYEVCEHDWDYDINVGWPHAMDGARALGILERVPMEELSERKVRNFRLLNTIWSAADALGICLFASAPTRALRIEEMAQLLSAVTGWETSSYELMAYGERRNQLMRLYNFREGLTAADDTLPDRFFDDPITDGAWAGTALDRATFSQMIGAYYRMMGWDELGCPTRESLVASDLLDTLAFDS